MRLRAPAASTISIASKVFATGLAPPKTTDSTSARLASIFRLRFAAASGPLSTAGVDGTKAARRAAFAASVLRAPHLRGSSSRASSMARAPMASMSARFIPRFAAASTASGRFQLPASAAIFPAGADFILAPMSDIMRAAVLRDASAPVKACRAASMSI